VRLFRGSKWIVFAAVRARQIQGSFAPLRMTTVLITQDTRP
jgi:hypothetical protein